MSKSDQADIKDVKFRLQNKIILLVVGVLLVGTTLIAYLSYEAGFKARERIAQGDMRRVSALIATMHTLYEKPDWKRTDDYIKTIMSLYVDGGGPEHFELLYVVALDENGKVGACALNFALARKRGISLPTESGEPLDSRQLAHATATEKWDNILIPDVNKIIMPMRVNGKNYGTIKVGYYVKQLAVLERDALLLNAVLIVVLCFLGMIVAIMATKRVVKPILDIVKAMKLMSAGDLEYRLPVRGNDETRCLAAGFNEMTGMRKNAIEDLLKREEDLASSERKYRMLFHSAGDSMLLLDSNGRCLDANEEAERMLGWPAGMLKGARMLDLVSCNTGEKELGDCPRNWQGRVIVPGGKGGEVEVRLARIDGGCIAVLRDITHWRESEDKINRIKIKQQRIIEALPVGIFTAGHDLNITGMNRYMEQLLEIGQAAALGESCAVFDDCLESCDLENALREALSSNKEIRIADVTARTPNGKVRIIDFRILRFVGEPGMRPSLLVVVNDVTDRHEMERMSREFESRAGMPDNRFAADAAANDRESPDSGLSFGDGRFVLVASENRDFLEMMTELLAADGFIPVAALGGEKAIGFYEKHDKEIALVVSDAAMSGMKAGDLFAALKKVNPGVKMILCSESGLEGEMGRQMAAGIQGFIQLPFDPAGLRKIVLKVLGL
ncbi:MAG: PAS domain-containing protein [bacterium]